MDVLLFVPYVISIHVPRERDDALSLAEAAIRPISIHVPRERDDRPPRALPALAV